MIRQTWKSVLLGTVVIATLFATVNSAQAWWWGCCRPVYYGWCSPCYSVCDPCIGWYGGCRAYRPCAPYRWSYCGGWCGSYGYSSCCNATYGCCNEVAASCCGGTTSTSAGTLTPTQSMPTPAKKPVMEAPAAPAPGPATLPEPGMTPAQPRPNEPTPPVPGTLEPAPAVPAEPSSTSSPTPENSGVVTIWVPFDAKVTVNGLATRSTGSRRQFVSYGLKPGFSYKYDIHAEVLSNGQLVEDTRTVTLTAGQTVSVAFGVMKGNPAEAVAAAN